VPTVHTFATLARVTSLQRSLFAGGEPVVDEHAQTERIDLGDDSWIDVVRCYLTGADTLFDFLDENVPWKQGQRWMYERVVDDPRLSKWYTSEPFPHPALVDVKQELQRRYGVPFGGVGLNYYRDGQDSVAFHSDRELREQDDTRICIVTLGARRPFLIRPKGGGRSIDLRPASGDLLVMGGACQMRWEHGVPKVKRAGPRISASYRWSKTKGLLDEEGPEAYEERRLATAQGADPSEIGLT
jgi:alkylated DNA repair dioxygenase AlkB